MTTDKLKKRWILAAWLFTAVFVLLTLRLFQIQILNGRYYANKAVPQQTLTIPIAEKRGNITDRNGIPFTEANEKLELFIFPSIIKYDDFAFDTIYKLTGKGKDNFSDMKKPYIKETITAYNSELIEKIEKGIFPGIVLSRTNLRYDEKSLARHVIGYLRKSDGAAVSGIEKLYEKFLHPGSITLIRAVTDAHDQVIPSLGYKITEPDTDWYDVQLALDYNIQTILEKSLDQHPDWYHGGLVVDAQSGDILALASRPQYKQYDPGYAGTETNQVSFLAIPFQQYPIGSVFKVIVAAAALESRRYTEESRFTCTGGIQVGSNFFPCHSSKGGLGEVTLREAFAYSCNDTFIRIAMDIGGDSILEAAKRFGFGESVNIELSNSSGTLMSKADYTGPGIANLAIGQGETMVTPLQIADMLLTLVNNGQRKQMQLVKGLVGVNGELKEKNKINNMGQVISSETALAISRWMADVTEYGTGTAAKDAEIGGTAGKTGTPQVSGDDHSDEYGWFAGFFPQKDPKYIIVIMSREKGGAANVAVPVFHAVARGIWDYESSQTKKTE